MTSPENKTILVLAPGGWSAGNLYDDFCQALSRRGIPSVAVDHLSNGAEPPTKGLSDDIQRLRQTLTEYADQGNRIVLVAHSYGGMVIGGAAAGLGLEDRAQAGLPGGVVLLVYTAAFVACKGESLKSMSGGQLPLGMLVENDYVRLDPTVDLIPDVPDETKARLAKGFIPHISLPALVEPATKEPWHTIPAAYIACDNDLAIPPALQDSMIDILPSPRVYHLPSGHNPFLSLPTQTADILEELYIEFARDPREV